MLDIDFDSYDFIIPSYSGGKDSLASLLDVLERGAPRHKILPWHQHIDGAPGSDGLMDWPCTEGYVKATTKALGLPIEFQWREGGFEGEMLRNNTPTGAVCFERGMCGEPQIVTLTKPEFTKKGEPVKPKLGTRLQFPQVSADLSVRWCSAYLKIDVAARALNNDERFVGKRILFLTGERREESTSRSKYAEFEPHRTHSGKKHVDHYRNVIDWTEQEVWDIIKRWRIVPHPCYRLGFSRCSCMACIFGNDDQWATVRKLARRNFDRIAQYEQDFGKTIHRKMSVVERADRGTPYEGVYDEALVELAMMRDYPEELAILPSHLEWRLPLGAFKHDGGPT